MSGNKPPGRSWLILGALFGFLAVAMAAYGRHHLALTEDVNAGSLFDLATMFHLSHALVLIVIGMLEPRTRPLSHRFFNFSAIGFSLGIVFFCGAIYWLALHGPDSLGGFGWLTPLGGTCFLIGWLALVVAAFKENWTER